MALPYPSTAFWSYAKEKGLVSNDMDFSKLVFSPDPTRLKNKDDFILLSEDINKQEFLKSILKMHIYFIKANFRSLFNFRNLKLRNLIMLFKKPSVFLPFIASNIRKLIKVIPSRC